MTPSSDAQASFDAARIAVLWARSAVVPKGVGGSQRYRLNGSSHSLTASQLAVELASLSKPVRLRAASTRGEVMVTADPNQPPPSALNMRARGGRTPFDRSILSFLYKRYDTAAITELEVICYGAGESVRVGTLAVVAWERDYWYDGPFGLGADFADSEYPPAQGFDPKSAAGAAAFISFGGLEAETFLDAERDDTESG